MADVIARAQEVGRPVGLEEDVTEVTVHQLVLIAVEKVRVGMGLDGTRIVIEQVGLDHVVVVEEAQEVTARGLDALVGVLRDAAVLVELDNAHALVAPGIGVNLGSEGGVLRARVHEQQLEVGIGLLQHGVRHLAQVIDGRAEERHDYREERGIPTPAHATLRLEIELGGAQVVEKPALVLLVTISRAGATQETFSMLAHKECLEAEEGIAHTGCGALRPENDLSLMGGDAN